MSGKGKSGGEAIIYFNKGDFAFDKLAFYGFVLHTRALKCMKLIFFQLRNEITQESNWDFFFGR